MTDTYTDEDRLKEQIAFRDAKIAWLITLVEDAYKEGQRDGLECAGPIEEEDWQTSEVRRELLVRGM